MRSRTLPFDSKAQDKLRFSEVGFLLPSIAVILLGGAIGIKYHEHYTQYAFVMHQNTVLFAGPDSGYHTLQELAAGSCVNVLQNQDGWCKVAGNGKDGWLEKKDIELV